MHRCPAYDYYGYSYGNARYKEPKPRIKRNAMTTEMRVMSSVDVAAASPTSCTRRLHRVAYSYTVNN